MPVSLCIIYKNAKTNEFCYKLSWSGEKNVFAVKISIWRNI